MKQTKQIKQKHTQNKMTTTTKQNDNKNNINPSLPHKQTSKQKKKRIPASSGKRKNALRPPRFHRPTPAKNVHRNHVKNVTTTTTTTMPKMLTTTMSKISRSPPLKSCQKCHDQYHNHHMVVTNLDNIVKTCFDGVKKYSKLQFYGRV